MQQLIECVPNFSEGNDLNKIDSIINKIKSVDGITILDVDPGKDTNRTVVTFIGVPNAVLDAAFEGIKEASKIIDMSNHKGTHPRIGATDVCPLIPIKDVTIEECVEYSNELAERVGKELKIPVYLYERSAKISNRKNLAVIREGEYEGLEKKIKIKSWKPDYGPASFNALSGATVIGCREFLIAYNINLNTKDKRLATDIAFEIREQGRSKRIKNPESSNLLDGEIVRNEDGSPVKVPGLFKDIKAIGWYVSDYNRAQISINFINYKVSSVHDVYDAVCHLAEDRGRLIVPHCWNSGIGISASAHLAIAIPHCPFIEYLPPDLTDSPLRTELADDGLTMTNGILELPDKPGLGIELNFEALDKFRASEIIL
mgnify:CR=1 FL=1